MLSFLPGTTFADFIERRGSADPGRVFITLILIGLFTTKDWVIKTVIPITLCLYCAYIALLFVSLP